jgi:hypothetical protein
MMRTGGGELHGDRKKICKKRVSLTRIRTEDASFKVKSDNHFTIREPTDNIHFSKVYKLVDN